MNIIPQKNQFCCAYGTPAYTWQYAQEASPALERCRTTYATAKELMIHVCHFWPCYSYQSSSDRTYLTSDMVQTPRTWRGTPLITMNLEVPFAHVYSFFIPSLTLWSHTKAICVPKLSNASSYPLKEWLNIYIKILMPQIWWSLLHCESNRSFTR